MTWSMNQATIDLQGYRYIKVTYDYATDKEQIDELVEKAVNLSGVVNPHSPDGKLRTQDVRFSKMLGGLIAEAAFLDYFNGSARAKGTAYDILQSTMTQDADLAKLGFNQIDIKLGIDGTEKDVEIRSSFSYKTSLNRLFGVPLVNGKGAFSLIGWYTSANKPREIKKDYYIFAIHFYEPSQITSLIYERIDVYLAAGSSRLTLEERGINTSLGQGGANFRVINPLNSVPDIVSVVDEILTN